MKFQPGQDYHNVQYASETIAHNGVLVCRAADDGFWKQYGKANAGGEILRRWPAEWDKLRGFTMSDFEIAHRGKILAWETSPDYDAVCGDASRSYSPTTVDSFTRQVVYVRPNLVFVYDRIETAGDGCKTTWLLHTADRPTVDGTETADKRVHPEGHYLWTGSTATVTDEEMGGRMFVRTVLPEKREVRLVGGEGHEFELPDGRNPGPSRETYALSRDSSVIRESRAEGEGLRGWRIEVEDRSGSRSVRFLHVFETTARSQAKMADCQAVSGVNRAGAQVTVGNGTVEVVFNATGGVGGHVTIVRDGKKVVNRDLATKIEDTYERWRGHPDYDKWMTDSARRSVVLGKNP